MTIYPYQKNSIGDYYPIIEVLSIKHRYIANILALVDSGANISVFTTEVAEKLSLNIEEGKEITLSGVGGRIRGYIHELKMEISNKQIVAPVVFSHDFIASFNLLGRAGIFEHFKILFEEKHLRVAIEKS